jgi:parallel beta-helix repeat protein
LVILALVAPACSSDATDVDAAKPGFESTSCADHPAPCAEIVGGEASALQEATQLLESNATLVLGAGTFELDNQVTIRKANGVTLIGQGIDKTTLTFAGQKVQANGVDVIGDDFRIEALSIVDAKKAALRVENSDGVTIRQVKVTWTGGAKKENGAYGLYPVRCKNVLVEQGEA